MICQYVTKPPQGAAEEIPVGNHVRHNDILDYLKELLVALYILSCTSKI